MTTVRSAIAPRVAAGLLVLRLALGITMLAHGYQKLFVFGFAGITSGFTQMGIPMPGIIAPLITLIEFFGGIAMVIGLLSRLVGLGFAIDMLGALTFVHFKNGFFMPTGFELVFVLLGMSVAVALAGPGALSIDGMIARRRGNADHPAIR
jgi:putative oxidoreductase